MKLLFEDSVVNEIAITINSLELSNRDNLSNSNKITRIFQLLNSGIIEKEIENGKDLSE